MKNRIVSMDNADQPELQSLNRLLTEGLQPIALEAGRHDALKQSLLARTAQSLSKQAGLLTVRAKDGVWQTLKAGIRVKPLWTGPAGSSVLIEFAPGSRLIPHRHRWLEEGIVLRGGLQMDELDLGPLDYHVSPAGSRHAAIQSRQGALAYLRGTSLGDPREVLLEVLGGLLPFAKDTSSTVFASGETAWQVIGAGIEKKQLWSDDTGVSCFYRLQAGARLPEHEHRLEEECMMLAGEAFLGDTLLRAGDYQVAAIGSRHGELYSDVGATLFVRGAREN